MNSDKERRAEAARLRYQEQLKAAFPSLVRVVSVHGGSNRAQRRWLKYHKKRTQAGVVHPRVSEAL